MAVPAPFSTKLREALGHEAGDELVTLLHDIRADVAQSRQETRADFAQMRADFAQFRLEMAAAIQASELRMIERMHQLEISIGKVDIRVAEVKADLIKWSFVFWVSAVLSIAALARVIR